jgi:glycosyltransferase involved in cell wall biosynthesis
MKHWIQQFLLNTLRMTLLRNRQISLVRSAREESSNIKQLLIDVSEIAKSDAKTGIQRVVRNLYQQLLLAPPVGYQVCPIMATRKEFYRHVHMDFLQQPRPITANTEPIQIRPGDIFLGLDLSAHLISHHLPELWAWKKQGLRMTFMIYDLLPVLHPEWFNPQATKNFHRWLRAIALYADSTIAISKTVQTDFYEWMQQHYQLSNNDIPCATISLGAELDNHEATHPAVQLPEQLAQRDFVLMVGTIEPRKGYDEALTAFEALWATGNTIRLVIVGKQGWKVEPFMQRLQTHTELDKRLIWLNQVDDKLLCSLYQQCQGVLMASKGEGYGLPLIEAMRFNKPILARDIAVFRDIAQDHISYFNEQTQTCLNKRLPLWLSKIICSETIEYPTPSTWQQACTALSHALSSNVTNECVSKSIKRTVLQKKASLQSSSLGGK